MSSGHSEHPECPETIIDFHISFLIDRVRKQKILRQRNFSALPDEYSVCHLQLVVKYERGTF